MNDQDRGGVQGYSDTAYQGGGYAAGGAGYPGPVRTVLTDVDIPFGRLVGLILKTMIASIPAYIILFIIFAIVGAVFGGIFAGLMGGMR
jgi:hypothetical protein